MDGDAGAGAVCLCWLDIPCPINSTGAANVWITGAVYTADFANSFKKSRRPDSLMIGFFRTPVYNLAPQDHGHKPYGLSRLDRPAGNLHDLSCHLSNRTGAVSESKDEICKLSCLVEHGHRIRGRCQ